MSVHLLFAYQFCFRPLAPPPIHLDPLPPVDQGDPYSTLAAQHFNRLLSRHGSPIVVLSLVKVGGLLAFYDLKVPRLRNYFHSVILCGKTYGILRKYLKMSFSLLFDARSELGRCRCWSRMLSCVHLVRDWWGRYWSGMFTWWETGEVVTEVECSPGERLVRSLLKWNVHLVRDWWGRYWSRMFTWWETGEVVAEVECSPGERLVRSLLE